MQGSEVKMILHFVFPKYQKHVSTEGSDYAWDIRTNPVQRLYLSQDTNLLMEVVSNYIGTVYERENLDE